MQVLAQDVKMAQGRYKVTFTTIKYNEQNIKLHIHMRFFQAYGIIFKLILLNNNTLTLTMPNYLNGIIHLTFWNRPL